MMLNFFSKKTISVGWVTHPGYYSRKVYLLDWFKPNMNARFKPVAEWINKNSKDFHNEIYNPNKKYNIVVFLKIMSDSAISEAKKIQAYGGKVIFDANVNYYEIWGEFPIPGTKPTTEQQGQAIWMTENADHVVADSTYIYDICKKYNEKVSWIPDNIDVHNQYTGDKIHLEKDKLILIWSGIAKKAYHFELIEDCLYHFKDKIHLILVTRETKNNRLPAVAFRMKKEFGCDIRPWDSSGNLSKSYHSDLLCADIIISPKILNNSYAMGHTEYKIAQGMAQRLPVIASNQQSYIDAFNNRDIGFIAKTMDDWFTAFETMLSCSAQKRQEMGDLARECIVNNYSVEVISKRYLNVLAETLYNESVTEERGLECNHQ
jgi:glycosyltransferase involved in cell wall biosynthesis